MQEAMTIWVCIDCILHHANGECGSCHDDVHGHDREPLSLIVTPFWVTMGTINGHDDVDPYSTSRCEGCGSWIHGERHAMTLWKD